VVVDVVDDLGAGSVELAQPAPVVLGLDREAVPLHAAVETRHLVLQVVDRDAGPNTFRVKMLLRP
jgi:hypothetical protein